MIGTLLWRINEALSVLTGRKNAVPVKSKNQLKIEEVALFLKGNPGLEELLQSVSVEFCFAEFGKNRVNAGGGSFSDSNRLNPTYDSLKKYFPQAKFTVYTDCPEEFQHMNIITVASPIPDKDHPRFLYRTADYFKFIALTNSDADFCCVMDSDMMVVSPEIYSLLYLTRTFGTCTASNPRNLLKRDMAISFDSVAVSDNSLGNGHSFNQSPMTLWKDYSPGKIFYSKCAEIMLNEPSRASLVMWKAARELGYAPYLLPAEWCVCAEDIGIGNEIILHAGHTAVQKYYRILS